MGRFHTLKKNFHVKIFFLIKYLWLVYNISKIFPETLNGERTQNYQQIKEKNSVIILIDGGKKSENFFMSMIYKGNMQSHKQKESILTRNRIFTRYKLQQVILLLFSCQVMSDSFVTSWTVACQAPLVHGISQARIRGQVANSFSRGSFQSRD